MQNSLFSTFLLALQNKHTGFSLPVFEGTATQRASFSLKGHWEVMIRFPGYLLAPVDDGTL